MSTPPVPAFLRKMRHFAFLIGGAGLVLCLFGAFANRQQFYQSYLLAWLFWVGTAAGCLALLMVHHLAGGGWGFVIRRVLEAGTRTFPLLAVLTVPLWFAMPVLYKWAQPEFLHGDRIMEHKAPYLNVPFFIGRTAAYFAVWVLLAWLLNKWSEEQDRTGDPRMAGRLEALSGPGLVLFGLTITFNSFDWAMSLEPHWFSTVYGLHFGVGHVLSGLAFAIVMVRRLADHEPVKNVIRPQHFHDLGNLMLAFVMLWAYLTFSQFLIIWSGNLPEEITWYMSRTTAGWQVVALILVAFHWALPFVLLLSRDLKRKASRVATVAAAMLFMRLLDYYWLIKPAFYPEGFRVDWLDICWVAGLGGVWLGYFCWELERRPLLPLRDPIGENLAAATAHGHAEPA